MKSNSFAFKARARTIDHLGKGQIADAPTAVSELWKNSYDAYARDVALHLFDGKIKCGAIIDNGCGMTLNQLVDSWMVIGTESKSKKKTLPPEDRFGLPERFTQGEKGIGRLSTSFLAPVTLLVTKKVDSDFSVALIDWRMFENTYLSLSDIKVPMVSVSDLNELVDLSEFLLEDLLDNLALEPDEDDEQKSIRLAWEKFSEDELDFYNSNEINKSQEFISTENKILNFCKSFKFNQTHMASWRDLLEKVEEDDGGQHGTALFLLDLERELSLLTNTNELSVDDPELATIKRDLVDTLRAFVDPFDRERINFNYEICLYDQDGFSKVILNQLDNFNFHDFMLLEHKVIGEVDEKGWFRGSVTAFGVEYADVVVNSNVRLTGGKSKVGKFELKIGSYEGMLKTSTLNPTAHKKAEDQAAKYSGVLILRDGLRVLPYGRVDNDFLEIEERRGLNAGRHFWANRRTFGHISLDQRENRNLKDKAGREGFIKNQAAREFKLILIDILVSLADRFFGRYSDIRTGHMESLGEKEKEIQKKAHKQVSRSNTREFKKYIKDNKTDIAQSVVLANEVQDKLNSSNLSIIDIDTISSDINSLENARTKLKLPSKPSKVDGKLEEDYRNYRDLYNELSEHIKVIKENLNKIESTASKYSNSELANKKFNSNQAMLNSQVNRYENLIMNKVDALMTSWRKSASEDRSKFHAEAVSVLDFVSEDAEVEINLNALDAVYANLADNFTIKYEAVLRALERLSKGINLDSAFSMAEEERAYFEDKASKLQALAQLGISVEVLAHELEQQDMLVTRGLNSLPTEIHNHPGYKTAFEAHKALTHQIRFLSPLKLSGYQARQDISGVMIEKHIRLFFKDRFERQRVELTISDDFRKISVLDLPSRIYPVFVNILNNALHWVSLSEVRNIILDVRENKVVIGNSGPEVDEEDIPRLFELFYSRRSSGHGVGLYLCRENLSVAHHRIWYAINENEKVVSKGANFVIDFNGMEFVS
ncbi:ATP-binding protein [Vibrio harveyi]|uniref:ATP-binding protein n=1 Tax=Vibrio harveyi TaxID=669 RepID=UPI00237D4C5A|nr:ATP-binding protein [Vibrio harveyi]HDM8055590.1 ATP-binding protein [Vibrio harveyi]